MSNVLKGMSSEYVSGQLSELYKLPVLKNKLIGDKTIHHIHADIINTITGIDVEVNDNSNATDHPINIAGDVHGLYGTLKEHPLFLRIVKNIAISYVCDMGCQIGSPKGDGGISHDICNPNKIDIYLSNRMAVIYVLAHKCIRRVELAIIPEECPQIECADIDHLFRVMTYGVPTLGSRPNNDFTNLALSFEQFEDNISVNLSRYSSFLSSSEKPKFATHRYSADWARVVHSDIDFDKLAKTIYSRHDICDDNHACVSVVLFPSVLQYSTDYVVMNHLSDIVTSVSDDPNAQEDNSIAYYLRKSNKNIKNICNSDMSLPKVRCDYDDTFVKPLSVFTFCKNAGETELKLTCTTVAFITLSDRLSNDVVNLIHAASESRREGAKGISFDFRGLSFIVSGELSCHRSTDDKTYFSRERNVCLEADGLSRDHIEIPALLYLLAEYGYDYISSLCGGMHDNIVVTAYELPDNSGLKADTIHFDINKFHVYVSRLAMEKYKIHNFVLDLVTILKVINNQLEKYQGYESELYDEEGMFNWTNIAAYYSIDKFSNFELALASFKSRSCNLKYLMTSSDTSRFSKTWGYVCNTFDVLVMLIQMYDYVNMNLALRK